MLLCDKDQRLMLFMVRTTQNVLYGTFSVVDLSLTRNPKGKRSVGRYRRRLQGSILRWTLSEIYTKFPKPILLNQLI